MIHDQIDRTKVISRDNLGVVASSAEDMDARRRNTAMLDYLCKLDEARAWIAHHIALSPSAASDLAVFYEELPKGEWLAHIARSFDPSLTTPVHAAPLREYLHTENINTFLAWLRNIRLSRHFFFEVIDLYESKNIPRVIYCIHGLAHFLAARGITTGIKHCTTREFSAAERALVSAKDKLDATPHFDDIPANLDSDEDAKQCHTVPNTSAAATLTAFASALLWRGTFAALLAGAGASLPALRRVLAVCGAPDSAANERREHELRSAHAEIIEKFRANQEMQAEKDGVLRTVRLLLENQARLRGALVTSCPAANDYRTVKRILYRLLHSPALLFRLLSEGAELPLSAFFPDTHIGDFHFSRFIEQARQLADAGALSSGAREAHEFLRRLARQHFLASRAFQQLKELFRAPAGSAFDLCPVAVFSALYRGQPQAEGRRAMLDEAMRDADVRAEIARRAALLSEYLSARLQVLSQTVFPYYVRLFLPTDHARFFEEFIEPAILLADSFVLDEHAIIAELTRYVFYSKDLFENQTRAFEQERLFYYNCRYDRTNAFDFTDYSPLKDLLDSHESRGFAAAFAAVNGPADSATAFFVDAESDGAWLALEISLNELNSVLIALKQHAGLMDPAMRALVAQAEPLQRQPGGGSAGEGEGSAGAGAGGNALASPIIVNGTEQHESQAPTGVSAAAVVEMIDAVSAKAWPVRRAHPNADAAYFEQRFLLRLDTQFIDEDCAGAGSGLALDTLARAVRAQVLALAPFSTAGDLAGLLGTTTPMEESRYAQAGGKEPLAEAKRRLREDWETLRRAAPAEAAEPALLAAAARDVLRVRTGEEDAEARMNRATLDALAKKEFQLAEDLRQLYAYLGDLFEALVCNRSGRVFNRQARPHSRYGTYRYLLEDFRPVFLGEVEVHGGVLLVAMDEPLVLRLRVEAEEGVLVEGARVGFDELLRLQEEGVASFECGGVCALNVSTLVDVVNEQYVSY